MGNWKAVRTSSSSSSWELYDLSIDIEESNNVAGANQNILNQMKNYADQAHATNIPGEVLDPSLAFDGNW